jgi:glycosyltransferase involved in cell wall biosynthesis
MITATISTYNREKYLPQVLESLRKQTLEKSLFEIIVVDNNSPGNTAEICENFRIENPDLNFKYCLETNQGLSHGRNRGIKESKGTYISFIDDDAFLANNYLEVIYTYFEANQSTVSIGSKILLHYENLIPQWENKYLNSLLGYFNLGDSILEFKTTDYPRGSNMSFRSVIFEEIGGFDVNLGRKANGLAGGEEKDIYNRIYENKKNNVTYIPNAVVFHCVPLERTTSIFIKKQAFGTGNSERVRTQTYGKMSYLKRWLIELFKWGASIILCAIFLLKGQPQKGIMIVRFRYWVSLGLAGKFYTKKNSSKI